MIVLLPIASAIPFIAPKDPGPHLFRTKTRSRNLDCEQIAAEAASHAYPGQIVPEAPRGDYIERYVVVCREHMMRRGSRAPRDEAILSTLESRASELAMATAVRPDLADRTWLVEAYYPSATVSAKLIFATKNALSAQGRIVSDRKPILAAGDVDVITRMHPNQAYPVACQRYYDNGSLGDNDALLAIVTRDPRETIVHAGMCAQGRWTWLR